MHIAFPKAREIFLDAVKLPPAEREKFLSDACGDDHDLRGRLDQLLRAHADAGSLPEFQIDPTANQHIEDRIGKQIGPYKLLELIGEGGMGLVYMAEQQQPVRRLVAVKIIKPGMDSRQVINRFEAERQALAIMDHSHIARVLDGGTTETGHPYFAMELVRGVPITEFCDQKHLTLRERLTLFIQVCQAVQHAHQKGIIHRDLKPTNVLVTMHDAVAFPKVIDFGIAKALGAQLTAHSLHTGFAQLLGTPLYMSPEQVEFDAIDVDTRSDVYSLGVLLYELLTGMPPFDSKTLRDAGLDEMRRIIREVDPPRPSQRISTLDAKAASTISQRRGNDGRRLHSLLRGELDWIVMKALDKSRSRRYGSATSLAADIGRYLADEPVQACPPSMIYRLQKLARRHKFIVALAAVIVAFMVMIVMFGIKQSALATSESRSRQLADEEVAKRQVALNAARTANATLREKQSDLRKNLYRAETDLAYRAWKEGQTARAIDLLDRNRPQPGADDLRGFEWHHVLQRCHDQVVDNSEGRWLASALSNDGKWFARIRHDSNLGAMTAALQIYDVVMERQITALEVPDVVLPSIAFSSDASTLAVRVSGRILLIDVPTGNTIRERKTPPFKPRQRADRSIMFARDASLLVVCYEDDTLAVLDGRTLAENRTWKAADVIDHAVSPDGRLIAGLTAQGKILLWETGSSILKKTFAASGQFTSYMDRLEFSPSGAMLAYVNGGKVRFWDLQSESPLPLKLIDRTYTTSFCFVPDTDLVATAGHDHVVRLWDVSTGQVIEELPGFPHVPKSSSSFSFSQNCEVWSCNGNLWKRSARAYTSIPTGYPQKVSADLACAERADIMITAATHEPITIWRASTGERIRAIGEPQTPGLNLAVSHDGTMIAAAIYTTSRSRLECFSGEALSDHASRDELGRFACLAFSPDNRLLATGGGGHWKSVPHEENLVLRDAKTLEIVRHFDGHPKIARRPPGNVAVPQPGDAEITSLAFSPNGRWLASGGGDYRVRIWDVESGQLMHELIEHQLHVNAVVFSADGSLLASGGRNEIKLWNSQTGLLLATLTGHEGSIRDISFSPNGRTLASTSFFDPTVRLWNVATRELVAVLDDAKDGVEKVKFTHDGKTLIGFGSEKIHFWRTSKVPAVN
jgi:WD40 repeat protein/serine/threonine protein kinase